MTYIFQNQYDETEQVKVGLVAPAWQKGIRVLPLLAIPIQPTTIAQFGKRTLGSK